VRLVAEIRGDCDPKFGLVREAFARNFEEGLDVGASVAVSVEGETVVDLWGGDADEAGRPWEQDTIVNVYSTTKTMTALCALVLAGRGELDFHAPVARYWPEFAQAGKEAIEVRHLMSHSSGLSGWDEQFEAEGLYDWERMASLLAVQAPWWEPGTASGYHSISQGYLVGEVVRRVSGKSLGTFFREEIAKPLGADFHIGLDASEDARVGELSPPEMLLTDVAAGDDSVAARTLGNPALTALEPRTAEWRRAEIPAAGGIGNARSVARVQSMLANGGEVDGVRLLSREACEVVFEEQTNGMDLVLGQPLRFGMGYGLMDPDLPLSPNARTCYWGGWGGSLVTVDLDARVCFAFVPNKMESTTTGDPRTARLIRSTYGALGLI
jgi:CubicO group peptidase (beta-lactamase class C family)